MTPAPPSSKPGMPQATVQLQKKVEPPSASKSVSAPAIVINQPATASAGVGEVSPVIGGIALVLALAALAMQVWIMVS